MAAASSTLTNLLVTYEQLRSSASSLDGLSSSLEDAVRFEARRMIQAAGILLRMPQDVIAQAIILLCRFWTGADGASMLEHDARDVAASALYLAVKPTGHTLYPRLLLTVFEYLATIGPSYSDALVADASPMPWSFTDGQYEARRTQLYNIEARMLSVLGFNTLVALPYTLCINYMQALGAFQASSGSALTKRAFQHLNSALFSTQLLYLTHQPTTIATAAIYLAARELAVKLPDAEWWEVFDVDREDLGFIVVALQSVEPYLQDEFLQQAQQGSVLTLDGLRAAMLPRTNDG